ncbi:unannotated protein [freshwater metagenome]|jgi:hypothetical protein|uniref:Unannotated protein n=1 Tax=freshwater metagenome TaxID=449393 RepID=A0A6J6JKM7_9ZZZZ|nr:hypothetical protein [Actinomycetota bacterium]MSZ24631.1 hypothetical protein [Actinomycetota bacterium]MSZ94074.1 hypothetical protein [Actinomycetota bacterium]
MEHLWFFVGILAGAAVRSPLEYLAHSLRDRRVVTPSPTVIVWQLFLIVLLIEFWIASLSVSKDAMGIGQFLLFLLLPFGAMVLATLSKPTVKPDVDQFTEFESQRNVFFFILAALPVISLLRELVAGESIPFDADLVYRILVFVGALLGLFIKKRRTAFVHALAMLALISTYLLDVYATVPV